MGKGKAQIQLGIVKLTESLYTAIAASKFLHKQFACRVKLRLAAVYLYWC